MTSDLELEGEIFRISTPKQQNIENPLGRARKPNFISKHVTLQRDMLSKICKCIPATLKIGIKRFDIQITLCSPHLLGGIWVSIICPIFKQSYHQKLPR